VWALLPFLAVLVGYFITRQLAATGSARGRILGYCLGGSGLIALGTIEAPDARGLQLFGLATLLFGGWSLLRSRMAGPVA
jgi:hypothetical protein